MKCRLSSFDSVAREQSFNQSTASDFPISLPQGADPLARRFSKLAAVFVSPMALGRNLCKSDCAGTLKFHYDFFLARNFSEILQLGRAITHRRTPPGVITSLEKVWKINCANGSREIGSRETKCGSKVAEGLGATEGFIGARSAL